MDSTGSNLEEASKLLADWINRSPESEVKNVLLARNPELYELLTKAVGDVFIDYKSGYPVPAPRGADGSTQELVMLAPEQIDKIAKLSGKEQFDYMQSIKFYPSDYRFVDGHVRTGADVKVMGIFANYISGYTLPQEISIKLSEKYV